MHFFLSTLPFGGVGKLLQLLKSWDLTAQTAHGLCLGIPVPPTAQESVQQVLTIIISSRSALGQGPGGKNLLGRLKHLVQRDGKGALLKPLAAVRVSGGKEVRKKRVGVQMDVAETGKCCRGSCPQVD